MDTIDLCDHKDRFTVAMKARGIPVTETISADDLDGPAGSDNRDRRHGDRSLRVKPAVGVLWPRLLAFRARPQLFTLFSTIDGNEVDPEVYLLEGLRPGRSPESRLIVMQYLPGVEQRGLRLQTTVLVVAHAVRQKSKDRQTVFTGGREIDVARAVASELKLDGLVNVQTKEDAADTPVLPGGQHPPERRRWLLGRRRVNLPLACARMMLGERVGDTSIPSPVVIRRTDLTYVLPRATAASTAGRLMTLFLTSLSQA